MPTHEEVQLRKQLALDVNRLLLETPDGSNLRRFRQQVDLQIRAIERYAKEGFRENMQDPMWPDFMEPRRPVQDQAELLPMRYAILAVIHDAFADDNTWGRILPEHLTKSDLICMDKEQQEKLPVSSARLAFIWQDNECFGDGRLLDAMVAVKADLASRLTLHESAEQPWVDDAPGFVPVKSIIEKYNGKQIDKANVIRLDTDKVRRFCQKYRIPSMRKGQRTKVDSANFDQAFRKHAKDLAKSEATAELTAEVVRKLRGGSPSSALPVWECPHCADSIEAAKRPTKCSKCGKNCMTRRSGKGNIPGQPT